LMSMALIFIDLLLNCGASDGRAEGFASAAAAGAASYQLGPAEGRGAWQGSGRQRSVIAAPVGSRATAHPSESSLMIRFRAAAILASTLALTASCAAPPAADQPAARTPIRHLIVVIGENMSFDNLYGTYEPAPGQMVANLLSKGIVNRDGSPGPHVSLAAQRMASVHERYLVTPPKSGAYKRLPQPGTTYALNQPKFERDRRFPATLPNGPFPITRYADWSAAVGDPVHRFFQMWQQVDGGRNDLFVWVAESSGEGSQNRNDPKSGTNQGGVAMGFYNMDKGDAPYFRELARSYALADNYHQPVMGGTGANYIALSTGDAAPYLIEGKLAAPPVNQIENPDPLPGTNNWYKQSGYKSGSYVECADPTEPGVEAIRDYLASLPYETFRDGNCEPGAYYLVNNYGTGFDYRGERKPLGPDQYTLPPQVAPTIGEALAAKGVSWKWYQGGRTADGIAKELYCDICDPFTHSTAIMTGPLRRNLVSLAVLDGDLASGKDMPAVAFVTPPNPESGHPAYSYAARYEAFIRDLVAKVEAHPEIWNDTAILVTTDEGGGVL
ncbi:MAG: alkaline phosphatase family protein, partial [Stellaceae bacterium]